MQLRLPVVQRHHVDAENALHLGLLVEVVQHDVSNFALAQFDDDAHAVLVGLVAQLADALDAFIATSSAIFSISRALFTWYGSSVTIIASRPESQTSRLRCEHGYAHVRARFGTPSRCQRHH